MSYTAVVITAVAVILLCLAVLGIRNARLNRQNDHDEQDVQETQNTHADEYREPLMVIGLVVVSGLLQMLVILLTDDLVYILLAWVVLCFILMCWRMSTDWTYLPEGNTEYRLKDRRFGLLLAMAVVTVITIIYTLAWVFPLTT